VFAASFQWGPMSAHSYLDLAATMARNEGSDGYSLFGLLARPAGATLARVACLAAATALVAHGWWAYRRDGGRSEAGLFASCLVAALVLTPVVWSHYLLLAFVPLLMAGVSRSVLLLAWLVSWVAAPPVGTPWWHGLSWPANVMLVQVALLGMLVAVSWRTPAPRALAGAPA